MEEELAFKNRHVEDGKDTLLLTPVKTDTQEIATSS